MTKRARIVRDDELMKFFGQHFVPLYFLLRRGEERKVLVWSAFPFSVGHMNMLLTAGHCITEMEEYWRKKGWHIEKARLIDEMNQNSQFVGSVPFDYDSFEPMMVGTDDTIDLGVLFPTATAWAAMRANGVLAFTEKSWDHDDTDFDSYKLLGVPAQWVLDQGTHATITQVFPPVHRLKRRPSGFKPRTVPVFWGRLLHFPDVKVQGMSGGPILGFKVVDGRQRYKLVAMQSAALRGKYVCAMLMPPFGRYLQDLGRKAREASTRNSSR